VPVVICRSRLTMNALRDAARLEFFVRKRAISARQFLLFLSTGECCLLRYHERSQKGIRNLARAYLVLFERRARSDK
jgi:hypothetical protein